MKKKLILLIAAAAPFCATADILKDVGKAVQKGVDTIAKPVEEVVQQGVQGAQGVGNRTQGGFAGGNTVVGGAVSDIVQQQQQAAAAAKAAIDAAAAAAAAYATNQQQQQAMLQLGSQIAMSTGNTAVGDIRQDQNKIRSNINKTYGQVRKTTTTYYNAQIAPYAATILSKEGIYRLAGKTFVDTNSAWIRQFQANMKNVDTTCLNQVVGSISAGRLSDETRICMVKLLTMMPTIGVPGNVTDSTFGVQSCSSSAVIAGTSGCVVLIINVKPNAQGKHDMALAITDGISLGVAIGAAISTGIFWAPGNIDSQNGKGVGFAIEGSYGVGSGAGLSWGIEKGMEGAEKSIPSVTLDLLAPAGKFEASFVAQLTAIMTKF